MSSSDFVRVLDKPEFAVASSNLLQVTLSTGSPKASSCPSQPRSMKPPRIQFAVTLLLISAFASAAASGERYAVFKSTDQGRSWTRSDAGIPDRSRINAFGSGGGVLIAGADSGVFISSDEARSWRPATGAAMSSGRVISLAALGKTVFAGTDGGGLLVSTDLGGSWVRDAAFPSANVRCLVIHGNTLYAGTDTDGVFVLGGERDGWTRRWEGLPDRAQVFALTVADGHLFAGLYSQGLFVWNEQERRWRKSGPVSPLALSTAGRTLIAGHNPGGLHWSDDLGVSWSRGTSGTVDSSLSPLGVPSGELSGAAPVWEVASNDQVALAGVSTGIYRSEDLGRTWMRAQSGLPAKGPGVAFLLNRSFVLAGISITNPDGEP